ncbi:MAG: VanW family protein [Clostridiales bacterium]|nr:VanW family protein [Clostridiales bacterium]
MAQINTNQNINRAKPVKTAAGSSVFKAMIVMLIVLTGVTATLGYIVYSDYNSAPPPVTEGQPSPLVGAQNEKTSEAESSPDVVDTGKIYDNIFIDGVDVSQLTKTEAMEILNAELKKPLEDMVITLSYEGRQFNYTYKDFGASFEFNPAVQTAYSYARDGSNSDRNKKISQLKSTPFEVSSTYFYDENSVKAVLAQLEGQISVPAKEASVIRENGEFIITKEQAGVKLDINTTALLVTELLKNRQEGNVEMKVDIDEPHYTEADLANAQTLIGTFTTTVTGGDTPRNTNVETALDKINNVVLYPEEVFSTNEHFGAMTYENGYRMANVIVGGKFEEDMGGGVCQVSSTLYVALVHAELEIVERTNHSLKVAYADYGYDATLAGDYIDLKFRNDTEFPVTIEGIMNGNKVTVNVYGHEIHSQGRTLELSNRLVSSTPPPEERIIEDPEQPIGYEETVSPARTGYKYELIKTVKQDGVFVEEVVVNRSTYKATAAERHIGINPDLPPIIPAENTADTGAGDISQNPDATQGADVGNTDALPPADAAVDNPPEAENWPDGIPTGDLSDFVNPQPEGIGGTTPELDLSILNAIQAADNM